MMRILQSQGFHPSSYPAPKLANRPLFANSYQDKNAWARQKLLKAKAPETMAKRLGGFVWSVYRHPNYWQIELDITGNQAGDRAAIKQWIEQHQEALTRYFEDTLGVPREQLYLAAVPLARTCCHNGCFGCLNNKGDKLKHHLDTPA